MLNVGRYEAVKQALDLAVAKGLVEAARVVADAQLPSEGGLPALLEALQPAGGVVVCHDGVVHSLGRGLAGQQCVVDAAAGRRLDEPRGVADRQDPVAVRPVQRLDGDAPSLWLFEYRAHFAGALERGQQAVHMTVQLVAGDEPDQRLRV